MKFNYNDWKIVLWGYKQNDNTFHYIHNAYNKAFQHLNAKVYWFDDNSNINGFDFSHCVFFTEGQVDKRMPIRNDCFYLLHNCDNDKYKSLVDDNKAIRMQVYTDDVLKYQTIKLDECIHADYEGKCIYFPWASDLLPSEIEANKPNVAFNKDSKIVHWIGTIGDGRFGNVEQINPFKLACQENGIGFSQAMLISFEENVRRIKESYMAPAIVGKWQHEVGYISCRSMKNISYGQMIMTNSPRIYEFMDRRIIHNNDTYQLFFDAQKYLDVMPLTELHSLMDFIKEKHTFLNRIQTILDFIDKTCD